MVNNDIYETEEVSEINEINEIGETGEVPSIEITGLELRDLTRFTDIITHAILDHIPIHIKLDFANPIEVLRSTYIVMTLCKHGYDCNIKSNGENIQWYCTPNKIEE